MDPLEVRTDRRGGRARAGFRWIAVLALAAAIVVALGYVGATSRDAERSPAEEGSVAPEQAPEAIPPPPALVGRAGLRGAGSEAAGSVGVGGAGRDPAAPAEPADADGTGRGAPVGAGGSQGGQGIAEVAPALVRFLGLSPGDVDDRVSPGSPPPWILPRSSVVGKVGAYGARDAGTADPRRWVGVAQVERDDRAASEASDDTREPASTAVKGLVVREDGSGIPGAEVTLYSSFYLRQAFYDHRVRLIGRVVTDAEGAFDLRPVALDTVHFGAGGRVLVTVRHMGHPDLVAQPVRAIVPGQESDIGRLVLPERSAVIHGVIRNLEGAPVVGAFVRVSGAFVPTDYDKTERMVVLDACPVAVTDAEGRYVLEGFAGGQHEVSVHVHIDCVLHVPGRWEGEREWSPRVLAGNSIRGRVVDPDGEPVAAAVVAGGGNWTPTNPDGTFWLDNVQAGPLALEVAHHAWHTKVVPGVATNGEEPVVIAFEARLARVTLSVVNAAGAPSTLVAIDWAWPAGGGPGRFAPDSRYWNDSRGVFAVTVPEGAVGATVSDSKGATRALLPQDLADGATPLVRLETPSPNR